MLMRIQQLAYQRRHLPLAAARPGPAQGRAAAAGGGSAKPRLPRLEPHPPQRQSDPGLFYNVLVEDSRTFKAI